MSVQYFAKVVNMQHVTVAAATTEDEATKLRQQQFEPCSRAFYESVIRNQSDAQQSSGAE